MAHTSFQLNRRQFLRAGLGSAAALAIGPGFLKRALAAGPLTVTDGPYGALKPFDANGIALPEGFTSREIARGASLVPGTLYPWHPATDGQATFPTLGPGAVPDGGWILVANSEMPVPGLGGVSGVEFAADGTIERAYRVLLGTFVNCAGGPTPWGTWLSCEEHDGGRVWECDPAGSNPLGTPRPALGVFQHEAATVDPFRKRLYLTEDKPDGCFYRFTPTSYPDLSAGLLEVATVDGSNNVSWTAVPDPSAGSGVTRNQVPGATRFKGGEGIWYDQGVVYFTTKGDNRVWAYHVEPGTIEVLYDEAAVGPDAPLGGVDNITVAPSGDVYVCEDGRDHEICMITPGFEVARFLTLDPVMHSGSVGGPLGGNETVGVVFNPAGDKMYFGAQRSFPLAGLLPPGVVYEVSGPFRSMGEGPVNPGGGGGGGAGAATPADGDRIAPGVRLRVPPKLRIDRFLRHGLPIELDLDEPAGVEATLRAPSPNGGAATAIGSASPSVAVRDRVGLTVASSPGAKRALKKRRGFAAELEIKVTDPSGNRATHAAAIRLFRKRRR